MRIILSLLLFLCLPLTSQADVITQDPNKPGAPQEAETVRSTDPRLTQKITCALGYTRLHTAVEELSKTSGVTIRCGTNNDDWPVRDIPVVVWVKDLPLGKVLETLAAATHTQLTSNRMDDIITYRMLSKVDRQIANYEQEKQKAAVEVLKWDWDTAVKLKDVPDSAYAPGKDPEGRDTFSLICSSENLAYARAVGAVLAMLGPEVMEQTVTSTESYQVDWDTASPRLRSALLELGRAALVRDSWMSIRASGANPDVSSISSDQVDRVYFSISCRLGEPSNSQLAVSVNVSGGGLENRGFGSNLSVDTSLLAGYCRGSDLGERSAGPEPLVDQMPAGYIELAKNDDGSDPALLKTAVTLVAPAGYDSNPLPIGPIEPITKWTAPTTMKDLASSDALVELAKTAGLSIISEDFQSHLSFVEPALLFGKERSIGEALRTFNSLSSNIKGVSHGERGWFVDEKNSLIFGRSVDWVRQHRDLAPEKLITNLITEANSGGVMFDDVLPVAGLSKGQREEWIDRCRALKSLRNVVASICAPGFDKLWALYPQLNNERKTMLTSGNGLPFSLIDPAVAMPVLSELKKMGDGPSLGSVPDSITLGFGGTEQVGPPEIGYCSWQLRRSEYDGSPVSTSVFNAYNVSNGPYGGKVTFSSGEVLDTSLADWHFWDVIYSYDNGDAHRRWSTSIGPFPVFSPKRLAELKQQAEIMQAK